MLKLFKPSISKIALALVLFVSLTWLWGFLGNLVVMDASFYGVPLHFYSVWGPCYIGWHCSEFNGLYLVLDILIWYVVSAFFVQGIKMVMRKQSIGANMTVLKSFLYLILAAGLGAWYFPLVLLPKSPQVETGILAYLAFPLWLIGGVEILWCFWDFTFKGRGTPLPLNSPKELVATGPYRYVRNPIYVGVLIIVTGYFLWFKTIWMIVYAVIAFLGVHLFVILYEEPTLKKRFGAAYENYCMSVPRWIPRFR